MGRRKQHSPSEPTHLTGVPGEQHVQQVVGAKWFCFCLEECCLLAEGKDYLCLCEECDCSDTDPSSQDPVLA